MFIKKKIKSIIKSYYYLKIKILLKINKNKSILINTIDLDNLYIKSHTPIFCCDRKISNKVDLSIIVPVYNCGEYIEKCILSVLNNKTKYKYELIIVNDGSIDNSKTIIDNIYKKYPNIIEVINKKNGGLSSARNAGLNIANGKYVTFLDSDDYIDRNYIEKLLSIAYKKNADIVKCGTLDINYKNGRIIDKHISSYEEIKGNMKEKILSYSSYAWGSIYKSSLFKNIMFPNNYWYEDMIIRFLIYRNAKSFINLNEIHHFRGIHNNQLTKQMSKDNSYKCLEQLYLIELLVEENKKMNMPEDVYMYLNVLHECSSIMVKRIKNINKNNKKQVFLRVCSLISSLYKKEYEKWLKGDMKLKSDIFLMRRYDLWLLLKYL